MNKSQQWSSSGCECTSGFEDIHLSLLQIDADQSKTASMFLHFVSFFSFLPPSGRCTEPAHMSLWCLLLKSLPPHPSLPESMVDCEHLAMILKQTAAKAGPQLGYRARAEARMPSLSLSPFSFSLCASFLWSVACMCFPVMCLWICSLWRGDEDDNSRRHPAGSQCHAAGIFSSSHAKLLLVTTSQL